VETHGGGSLLGELVAVLQLAVFDVDTHRRRGIRSQPELRADPAVLIAEREGCRTIRGESERRANLAVLVGDGKTGRSIRLHPETGSDAPIGIQHREERVLVLGKADRHTDVAELVHDLELLGSNDTLLHDSWARLGPRAYRRARASAAQALREGEREVRGRRNPRAPTTSRVFCTPASDSPSSRGSDVCQYSSGRLGRRPQGIQMNRRVRWRSGSFLVPA